MPDFTHTHTLRIELNAGVTRRVGGALERFPSLYFTGHCTGEGPYRILKEILGDRLQYMGCGLRFTL